MAGRLAKLSATKNLDNSNHVDNEQERPRTMIFVLSNWEHIISFGVGFAYYTW